MSRTLLMSAAIAALFVLNPRAGSSASVPTHPVAFDVESALFAGDSEEEVVHLAYDDAYDKARKACVSNGFGRFEEQSAVEVVGPGPERADAVVSISVLCKR